MTDDLLDLMLALRQYQAAVNLAFDRIVDLSRVVSQAEES